MIMENRNDSDEEDQAIVLLFPRWNYQDMIIDLIMIIYWLKWVFLNQNAVD